MLRGRIIISFTAFVDGKSPESPPASRNAGLCLCALQTLQGDFHARFQGKSLLEKLGSPLAVASLQKYRAKVAGNGGIGLEHFGVKIHGLDQIGLGLNEICPLGKGHAYIIIKRGIVWCNF